MFRKAPHAPAEARVRPKVRTPEAGGVNDGTPRPWSMQGAS